MTTKQEAIEKMAEIMWKSRRPIFINRDINSLQNLYPLTWKSYIILAQALWDAGYMKVPELTVLADEEIESVVSGARDLTPSGFVKAGAQAQRDHCQKEIKGGIEP